MFQTSIYRLWRTQSPPTALLALLLLLAVLTTPFVTPAFSETPVPTATGPIPATAESYPFGAANHTLKPEDLSRVGYVEEEYFLSGQANVYAWTDSGGVVVRTSGAPYTTRVLIRRPVERGRFSGTVVVEMLNPSNLFDLNIGWGLSGRELARHGDVWVGVTSKPISVVALKRFDKQRYARLSWANPLPKDDPRNCSELRGDTTQETENGLVWDIFTQLGAWLRSSQPDNPLTYGLQPIELADRHPVEVLYGWGYSQTGSFLYSYINGIQPRVKKADGRAMYDGYIVGVAGGPTGLNQCDERPAPGSAQSQFNNAGTPILRAMTQSDYLYTIKARRPDSDEPTDRFRNYEIAGSGHASPHELYSAAAPEDIVEAGLEVPPMSCNEGPRSRFPSGLFFNAALRNLDRWVREGVSPPKAEPIQVENGKPVLDRFGNVKGGVRSPWVDVPTSTWHGNSTGPSFCRIAGHEVPFDKSRLSELYQDHQAYVSAVENNVAQLVAQRFLTAADGEWVIEQARQTEIP